MWFYEVPVYGQNNHLHVIPSCGTAGVLVINLSSPSADGTLHIFSTLTFCYQTWMVWCSVFLCCLMLQMLMLRCCFLPSTCVCQHFLCGVSDSEIPRLSISYARSDLNYIRVQCEMYVSRLRQLARQLTLSRYEAPLAVTLWQLWWWWGWVTGGDGGGTTTAITILTTTGTQ